MPRWCLWEAGVFWSPCDTCVWDPHTCFHSDGPRGNESLDTRWLGHQSGRLVVDGMVRATRRTRLPVDSQAREFPEQYLQVLRVQWIGGALGEEDVSIRNYGKGGGFWNGLAFCKKRAVVEDKQAAAVEAELATLSAEEARLLGESDKVLDDGEVKEIKIPEEDKKIVVAKDGTITVPAVACTSPKNNTDKVAFLKSWDGGMQIHYQRLGERPELLKYTVEVPAAGKYELTMNVCTVSKKYAVIARLNRRTLVTTMLPYSKGAWERTEPEVIELREGRNTIQLTFRAPNRGVSIKEFQLKPVK